MRQINKKNSKLQRYFAAAGKRNNSQLTQNITKHEIKKLQNHKKDKAVGIDAIPSAIYK